MTPRAAPQPRVVATCPTRWSQVAGARGTAVMTVWLATLLMSLLAPDLVSGTDHRHVPLVAVTVWLWAAVATGFLRLSGTRRLPPVTVRVVAVTWVCAAGLGLTAPDFVAGTDPTLIPLTPCVTPILAALVTGYAVLGSVVHGQASPSRRASRS